MSTPDKICLTGARARMRGESHRAADCGDCIGLNIDPLFKVRAIAARPSPLAGFTFDRSEQGSTLRPEAGALPFKGPGEF